MYYIIIIYGITTFLKVYSVREGTLVKVKSLHYSHAYTTIYLRHSVVTIATWVRVNVKTLIVF